MEVNKKQLADIFGASIRTIQNWQEQGMPVLRGGGKGNEVLYDSAAVIKWYAETRRMFAQKVSAYTGLSVQAVLDTEAAVYSGQEAIDAGLADELVNSTDAITVMRDALDARKSRLSGGRMTKETQSTTVSATASQADVTDVVQATEGENASAAQPDVNAQITAAVAAENSRIMGILNCEEAHGREEQARVLAETPGMTVETARRILAAAPQSAQARSDTALDRLMQGAPAPLAAGNPASDAVNDLLNTPV